MIVKFINRLKSLRIGRREGALLATCLILLSVVLPTFDALVAARRYVLADGAQALIGKENRTFAGQIKFDPKVQAYTLNAGLPAAQSVHMHATVGASKDADKAPYGLSLHRDFSRGVTMTDANTGLSFDIVPQFKALNGLLQDGRVVYPVDGGSQAIYSVKGNGLKEDIILPTPRGNDGEWKYQLKLPDTLQARLQSDGSIGIFSADPFLFGNISFGSDADKAKVESAREHAPKDHLLFAIPAPVIKQAGGAASGAKSWFTLGGNDLTVHATGLTKLHYPISVDPSVVVTSTSDFLKDGNNESMIDYGTSGQITRGTVTLGSVGAWTDNTTAGTDTFTTTRGGTVTLAYNGYLYVLGGSDGSTTADNDVQYAPIAADGSLGAWKYTYNSASSTSQVGGFATGRETFGAVIYNGYMYVIAGHSRVTGNDLGDTQYAKINADGTVGTWVATASLPVTKNSPSAVAYNGFLYLVGGSSPTTGTTDTMYAPIHADGSIGAWAQTSSFTNPRDSQSAVAYNGYMYILGGYSYTSNAVINDVQYAPIESDGTVGTWVALTGFTTARDYAGVAVYGGYLYIIEGETSATNHTVTNDVQYAPVYSNGRLGAWKSSTGLPPKAASVVGATVYNGSIYVAGGHLATGAVVNDTQYAKINPIPANLPSGPVNFGKTTAGASIDTGQFNHLTCSQYTSPNFAGTVTSMSINVDSVNTSKGSSQTYSTGIYDTTGSGGGPGALIGSSASASTSVGWNTVTMNVNVTASTTYWLCWENNSSRSFDTANVTYDAGATNAGASSSGTISNGTWNSNPAMTFNTKSYAVYATVTPPATPTFGSFGTSWSTGAAMPAASQVAATVAYNGYLYSIGGNDGTAGVATIEYAKFNPDGSLGTGTTATTWFPTTPMPEARQYLYAFANNGYLYIIGGYAGAAVGYLNTVRYIKINADGTLGTNWINSANTLNTVWGGGGAAVYNGYVYLVAGTDGTNEFSTTEHAQIQSTGDIGPWTTDAATIQGVSGTRSSNRAVAYNGYLYTLGGGSAATGTELSDVEYTKLDSTTGAIGSWTVATAMPTSRDSFGIAAANGYIYVWGGINGVAGEVSTSYYAPINADGSISSGAWTATTSLPSGRDSFGYTMYKGYAYTLGGYITAPTTAVLYTQVNSIALIGHYSKLIDLGAPVNVTGITYAGSVPGGAGQITYRAAGADGVFGATARSDSITSTGCSSNLMNTRYLLVSVTLDDSSGASATPAYLTDLTVNYSTGHPSPSTRLRLGKTLQNGMLSALDTCAP